MDPVSPLPAVVTCLVALATAFGLSRFISVSRDAGRAASIDGLRGYLALFVFLHHSCVWYFYLRTGRWGMPPSQLYTHFGESSVALFFMITGFLFFSKLLDRNGKPLDWTRLYIGRVLRLAPLYLFAMAILFLIVVFVSRGDLNQSVTSLAKAGIRWVGFTILGAPNLNGVENTFTIIAGVTWSLPYEWFFYLSLPMLALMTGKSAPRFYTWLGIAGIIGLIAWHPNEYHLIAFAGGIVSALLVRQRAFQAFSLRQSVSFVVLGLIAVVVTFFPTVYATVPLMLLSIAFSLIAGGCTLFNALSNRTSKLLGDMTYSIYLLHGFTLFAMFNFVVDADRAKLFSPLLHWSAVVALCPILLVLSYCSFRFIEQPAMNVTGAATSWVRTRIRGRRTASV